MYPSHAQIRLAPISYPEIGAAKYAQYVECAEEWDQFAQVTQQRYGVTMSALEPPYKKECLKYFLQTANEWSQVEDNQLGAHDTVVFDIDCNTCRLDEVQGVDATFEWSAKVGGALHGFVGWFDVHFRGSEANPAHEVATLSTAPSSGYTHWGHSVMPLYPGEKYNASSVIAGRFTVSRKEENPRRLDVQVTHRIQHPGPTKGGRGARVAGEDEGEAVVSDFSMD